jgi:alkylation response protein AidB-like acyl-CoA dehydrogenase
MTEATPADGGHVLNGRKIFGTIAPAAHLFFPSVRIPNGAGGYLTATAMVPRDSPGLEVKDGWDALGMRASGSNDIVFKDCFVPEGRIFGTRDNYGKVGRGFADFALTANLPLISTFLGVAEAARDLALAAVKNQRKGPNRKLLGERIPIQHLVAEMEVDLSVSRALTERLGRFADEFLRRYAVDDPPSEQSNALMKEVQCMKYVVNRKAIEVVDRAMIVCGGGAYMSKHPLSRLYRDARAGPFMQPFAPYEAFEYIGKVALGMEPVLDR